MWKKYLKEINFPESYISITLGFLVVIVSGLLMFNYFSKNKTEQTLTTETTKEEVKKEITLLPIKHTVAKNESLWTIAEKYYQSGYNWITIARENNLSDPNLIKEGQQLSIPKADIIKLENGSTSSTATGPEKTYTVKPGDNLWQIAVSQYNDGYAWVRSARANSLVNPNVIHSGNVLTLPR